MASSSESPLRRAHPVELAIDGLPTGVTANCGRILDECDPDQPVFHCGSSRPNEQFQRLCDLAGVKPKQDVETGADKPWVLKDLRKRA